MSTTYSHTAYFVTVDGQGDMLLAIDEAGTMSDAELIEAAVAEAHDAGLIGERDEDSPHFITEGELRAGLHIGEYTR